jgi:myo-inositol-1(or 4)-monophosphatase
LGVIAAFLQAKMTSSYSDILERIEAALGVAGAIFTRFTPGRIQAEFKAGHDPVTEADRAVDIALRENLLRNGEGWLSEETVDDLSRLQKRRVWIVDPLDGTREFVEGIPEFCISIGFVEDGYPVAGGICNPATRETFIGAIDAGMLYNGRPTRASQRTNLSGATVLASRSEIKRGEWKQFEQSQLQIRPMGSVAYKLALVSAGLADTTFTLTPKHEWDIAAGVALVISSGGFIATLENTPFHGNSRQPLIPGLIAGGAHLRDSLLAMLKPNLTSLKGRA